MKKRIGYRLILFFVFGAMTGYYWLLPAFNPPGSPALTEGGVSIERILRVGAILFFLPLVLIRFLKNLTNKRISIYIVLIFIILPLISIISFPDLYFFIGGYSPLMIAGFSILCLYSLNDKEYKSWLFGIGLASVSFLIVGLTKYGLEPTTYFGSERTHFGFIHPTQSASIILMSGFVTLLFIKEYVRRKSVFFGLLLIFLYLLFLAYSRNALMFVLTAFIGFLVASWSKKTHLKYFFILLVLLFPYIMLVYAVSWENRSENWQLIDILSSGRLGGYRDLINNLSHENFFDLLIGPSNIVREFDFGRGFAASESVYSSLFLNFGLMTYSAFFMLFLYISYKITRLGTPLVYGVWCGIIVFFAIDAQGITPSNLSIFLLFSHVIRDSFRIHSEKKVTAVRNNQGSYSPIRY